MTEADFAMRILNKIVPPRTDSRFDSHELEAHLNYHKLESRRVLSATFAFGAGQLLLDNFDAGQDLMFSQQDAIVNGMTTDAYLFELASGSWTGSISNPEIEVESVNGGINNQLQVATSLFGSAENSLINIDGATGTPLNIDVSQLVSIFTTGTLELSNISSVDSSLQLLVDGDVSVDNIEILDSNPNDNDTLPASLRISATGDIEVGNLSNQMDDPGADISLAATGVNSDVTISGIVETVRGSISIRASDSVLFGEDVEINSGQSGVVVVVAGTDGTVDDDLSRIEFASGASVDAGSGFVILDTSMGGDILLGNVSSTSSGTAISVVSGQNIFDNTNDELANLSAVNGTINISASDDVGMFDNFDFFKSAPDEIGLVELESRFVNVQAGQNAGISELSTTDTTFLVDADSAFLVSAGNLIFQNGNSPISQLALISPQSVILPAAIAVTDNLRIEADDQVSATDGTIDIWATNLLFVSGASQTIRTAVSQLDAAVAGDLVVENDGDLELIDLNCDLVAVISNSNSGSISISTGTNLTVSDDLIAGPLDGSVSDGNIDLSAENIQIDDAVLAGDGDILIDADDSIANGSMGVISTIGGDIDLLATTQIQMQDGARIVAGRDNSTVYDPILPVISLGAGNSGGTIQLDANQNISLGSIESNNDTAAAIRIVSHNGQVTDGGDADVDLIAEQPNAIVSIESAAGIGSLNALETHISTLVATTTGSGNIGINESNAIQLLDVDTTDGAISVNAAGDILAVDLETGETESSEDFADNINLASTFGSIFTTLVSSVDNVSLTAAGGSISDSAGGSLTAAGNGTFVAQNSIEFGNAVSNLISIDGIAAFDANLIQVGQDGNVAGGANAQNVFFGSLTASGGDAVITEDDATLLTGTSELQGALSLASSDTIENTNSANVTADQAQFNAPNYVYLGNQADDEISIGSLGTFTIDAHFELDSGVILNGSLPDDNPVIFGTDPSLGINVDQTMFASSVAEIVQETGELHVRHLALNAGEYVHLAAIENFNETIGISAGTPGALTDPTLITQLDALGNVENGEVDATLPQSIAFLHLGSANLNIVNSPTGVGMAVGLVSSDGSVFASSTDAIQINQDIIAISNGNDPQVTLYVANGTTTDPGIEFAGTEILVDGQNNFGIVNQPFTTATFFDAEGSVLEGTTEFLVLNPDGSADQNIVLEYANPGEAGYRVGVVWDIENQPGSPVENPNTFVANVSDPTEEFDDAIYQDNATSIHPVGGNEGGGPETIGKIDAYSKDAIIAHQFDPKVFSEVTVRNDQNINLFFGPLDSVDNSLNETRVTIRADLDSPKRFALALPEISAINPIEVRTAIELPTETVTPDDVTTSSFERDVQPFETGELRWVRVTIPLNELESFGDEVRLKDPNRNYPRADDAQEFEIDPEIGENEIEKIIGEIETNRQAEAGYWYKVYKDYQNRDDELFFYHLKTGEVPQPDLGPESDFLETKPENDNGDEPESDAENDSEQKDSGGDSQSMSLGISTTSLLLAGLMKEKRREKLLSPQGTNQANGIKTTIENLTSVGFRRIDRLKRRLKQRWIADNGS